MASQNIFWVFQMAFQHASMLTLNPRMVEAGRDLWRTRCPNLMLQQGHLQTDTHVQAAFGYLWGWRIYNPSGQPVPELSDPHSKKVFPDVSYFSLCPLLLVLSLGTTWKCLAPSPMHSPCTYLYTLMRSPWHFSSLGRTATALSAFFLPSY